MTTDTERIIYACSTCGATNCKLWRPAQTFAAPLFCANCVAERDDTTNLASLDKNGMSASMSVPDHRTYCLGGYHIPAVPTADWTTGFWGYSAIPPEGLAWWHYLPSLPAEMPKIERYDCGIRGCTATVPHAHAPHEINSRRLDAIASGAERGDPMG